MSDAERSLDININTKHNAAGSKEAEKNLANVKEHAEGAAHGFIHAESQGKAFHKLLHSISHESPLLGEALRLALNPVTGIIMGIVLALEYWKKKNDEVKEFMKKLRQENEATNERIRKSTEDVTKAQIEEGVAALEAQQKMIDAQNSLESVSNRAISAIKLQSESIKALADIQEKYELSQATTDQDKEKIKAKYELINGHIKEDEELKILVATYNELEAAKKKSLELDKSLESARNQDNRRSLAEEKERLQGLINSFRIIKEGKKTVPEKEAVDRDIRDLEDDIRQIDAEAKDAAARVSKATQAKAENAALVNKLTGDLPGMESAYQQHAAVSGLQGSPLSGIISAGADALRALREHGGKVNEISKDQLQAIRDLTQMLTMLGANNTTMVNLIEKSAGDVVKLNARLQALENRLRSTVTPY